MEIVLRRKTGEQQRTQYTEKIAVCVNHKHIPTVLLYIISKK